MSKLQTKTIDAFFKRKRIGNSENVTSLDSSAENSDPELTRIKSRRIEPSAPTFESLPLHQRQTTSTTFDANNFNIGSLERDPGLRPQIQSYPVNSRDEIRRAYIRAGPYQISLSKYPLSGPEKHPRRFQESWFTQFATWLEYSPTEDAAYCLSCYIFNMKTNGRPGWDVFIVKGFKNWKKVNDGKNCAFLGHIGDGPCSPHNNAVKYCTDLIRQSGHIAQVINTQSSQQIESNRLRVKTSIDVVRWLTFQGCPFRGHDETPESINRGNFLMMVQFLASYNEDVYKVVLENAPQNAKYTSPTIQKEILHVFASKVRNKIREDVGDSKFCIIVDEARDESKREQMALILRFVEKMGFIQEHFFDIAHVRDTCALTLKTEISAILSRHCLDIQNIRGQGYDGASNMSGEWRGLQALFTNDCPFAYYVHCFAHRLQLALVAASREVGCVHEFFSQLTFITNTVGASCKRHDDLQSAQAEHITHLLTIDELETGKGVNQIGTLKRACDSRWGSHFYSICSLVKVFHATCVVLENIETEGSTYSQRGDAIAAYKMVSSFEFIFVLHLMKEILGITDVLCQALQQKSQDISNVVHLVSTSKTLLQKFREDGWNKFFDSVTLFCKKNEIEVPDFSARYIEGRRGRNQRNHITIEHHYHFDVYNTTIDFQMQELSHRFDDNAMELLKLSSALDPSNAYKSFNVDDIINLVEKYYPSDFTEHEKDTLRFQLSHFELDVPHDPKLQNLSSIAELCQKLVETKKAVVYNLVDRLIRLVLTLPVSTASGERAFSAMKIVKTRLRNKMEDEFLADNLVVYIEKEVASKFSTNSILADFVSLKECRVQF